MFPYSLFTPPTRTRRNCLVLSCPCRRCDGDKTRQFCQFPTQFPICNCSVSNIWRITENLEIGNWVETRQNSLKLGRYKTKLSCFVCSCIHTADADQTRQSCLVRVGGVNKLLAHTVQILYGIRRQLTTGACIISVSLQETGSQVS